MAFIRAIHSNPVNTDSQFMMFSYLCLLDFPYTSICIGLFTVFYHGVPIDHCTNFSGPFAKPISESEYNTAYTAVMAIE